MNKKFLLLAMIVFSACTSKPVRQDQQGHTRDFPATVSGFSQFIPADSANKMITSYLNSINYTANDTDLRALIINMSQLRKYTDSLPSGTNITNLKLFFGHTLEYINTGNGNRYAGYKSGALTLIIAGYDSTSGNYIYYNTNNVLEYSMPCPNSCPSGDAGGNLLTF